MNYQSQKSDYGGIPYSDPRFYVPSSISEFRDMLGNMILSAPTFRDRTGYLPFNDIESEFTRMTMSLSRLRKKLGEDAYARLTNLASRAKALFAADQDDTNGKTDEGRELLFQMEDVIREVSRRRKKAKLPDDEGEVTGD